MKPYSSKYIMNNLDILFPDAHCELNYHNSYQLLIAVVLSAQTTDINVNKVTPVLFEKYPDPYSLSHAQQKDVEEIIHSIGLYRNKSKNIISLCNEIQNRFEGTVPGNREDLQSLPGVGRKTANVVLSEYFNEPALAVDTHVSRVSVRMGIAEENDSVNAIEEKLCNYFPKKYWHKLHHQLIFFGRYKCRAVNPDCSDCPFRKKCTYFSK